MERFPENELKKLLDELGKRPPITIITHFNPDGDAIGSSMALKLYLEKLGFSVDCLFPSPFPPYYNWIPQVVNAKVYTEKEKGKKPKAKKYFEAKLSKMSNLK